MKMSGFWGYFEEDSISINDNQTLLCQTQTRHGEEPDQGIGGEQYSAISNQCIFEMQTLTEQREEPDQDIAQSKYMTFNL